MINKFSLLSLFGIVLSLLSISEVKAQLIPDQTLPQENSIVTPINSINNRIDGGAIRGTNLFHSFQEFNINQGQSIYFSNPTRIENIFTRVTGNNSSSILGKLGVLGNANFWLINPHGIYFGPDASLDIKGSFIATTNNRIKLGDNIYFGTKETPDKQLLTIQPSALFDNSFKNHLSPINNQANLEVGNNQNLILLGGEVTITGKLSAPGGSVSLLGENINLLDHTNIDVSSPLGGGQIFIGGSFQGKGTIPTAQTTYIGENVTIKADALSNPNSQQIGNGGNVVIWSEKNTAFYGNISAKGVNNSSQLNINSENQKKSDGGFVEISSKQNLIFRGNVNTSAISGKPGTLLIDPENITIAKGVGIDNQTTIYQTNLEQLSGDNNLILEANNNITLEDLDNSILNLSAGQGKIAFIADRDRNGIGSFTMNNTANTIQTNARDLFITGASLNLGNIITSGGAINLNATNGHIQTGNLNSRNPANSNFNAASLIRASGNIEINSYQGSSLVLRAGGDVKINGNINITGIDKNNFIQETVNLSDQKTTLNINSNNQPTLDIRAGTTNFKSGIYGFQNNITPDIIPINSTGTKSAILINGNITNNSGLVFLSNQDQPQNLRPDNISTFSISTTSSNITNGGDIFIDSKGEITINNQINTSSNNKGGSITFLANDHITLKNTVRTRGNNNSGGNINLISHNNIFLQGPTRNDSDTSFNFNLITLGRPKSGDIKLIADQGININFFNILSDNSQFDGLSGNIILDSQSDIVAKSSIITNAVRNGNQGENGGDININAKSFIVSDNSLIQSKTFGNVNAGNVNIKANEAVYLSNNSRILTESTNENTPSDKTAGNAGHINITAQTFNFFNNSELTTRTRGSGQAGNVQINANMIVFDQNSAIKAESQNATGTGGEINILTNNLLLNNASSLASNASGSGNAGNIIIKANQGVIINSLSTILANTTGEGNAGNIEINTTNLDIKEAEILAATTGEGNAGNINFNADNINIENQAKISATTAGGKGGSINITGQKLNINSGSKLLTDTSGNNQAGNINIQADESIKLDSQSNLSATTSNQGNAGNINITTPKLTLENQAKISTLTENQGKAGDITFNTPELTIANGSSILASTSGSGHGGTVTINAPNFVNLGLGVQDFSPVLSVETSASGKAGDIVINTANLTVSDTARITATATNTATNKDGGGSITLNASKMNLAGLVGIFAETQGTAPAGTLKLNTYNNQNVLDLNLFPGAIISASTSGSGNGGNLEITAPDTINITGKGTLKVETTGKGQAGNININTQKLNIIAAIISASTSDQATGTGGNINIKAKEAKLDQDAAITAKSVSSNGGNINLEISRFLMLLDPININATAGTAQAGGNGGNIKIKADYIIGFPSNPHHEIKANAYTGKGGNINITTNGIFGGEYIDIQASSQFGVQGTININTPGLDPSQGLTQLPTGTVDISDLIKNYCQSNKINSFRITGRKGVPLSPMGIIGNQKILIFWGDKSVNNSENVSDKNSAISDKKPQQLIESQGWIKDNQGRVMLTSQPVEMTANGVYLHPLDCERFSIYNK